MTKTVNYTPEAVDLITGMYLGVRNTSDERRAEVVKELAEILEKDVRSIRGKLARLTVPGTDEQLYVRKAAKSKVTGGEPAKKLELAVKVIGMNPALAKVDPERVAKMNKTDIMAFIEALTPAESDETESDETESDETESDETESDETED